MIYVGRKSRVLFDQANGLTLTLVANALRELPNSSRKFHLNSNEGQQVFSDYLLRESLPSLIIKIIGTNHQQSRYSVRASIQNALKSVLLTLMEQTRKSDDLCFNLLVICNRCLAIQWHSSND